MPSDFLKKAAGDLADAAKGAVEKAGDAATDLAGNLAGGIDGLVGGLQRDKEVIAYPTYGYRKAGEEGAWVIRLRVWVNKARRLPVPDELIGVLARDMQPLDAEDIVTLRKRVRHFVADDDSRERVSVRFKDDPEGRTYDLPGLTDHNGLVEHDLEIPDATARALLAAQGSDEGRLAFTAISGEFEGEGRARLVEPTGLSVISDIDDTIKITEVPAGKRVVLRNTFLRDYVAVPGMAERYRALGDGVMFHYVSGSPWQLYTLLGDFLSGEGFPEGAFHMKDVRKNLLDPASWQDFRNFAAGDEATFEQKLGQITRVMLNLPRREFILVGDSGEKDPEVFRELKKTFGAQVREIFIRDVVDERSRPHPNRLEGMTVIEAPTIVHGVTQFTD